VKVVEDCLIHTQSFSVDETTSADVREYFSPDIVQHLSRPLTASDVAEPTNCGADGTVSQAAGTVSGNGQLPKSVQIA